MATIYKLTQTIICTLCYFKNIADASRIHHQRIFEMIVVICRHLYSSINTKLVKLFKEFLFKVGKIRINIRNKNTQYLFNNCIWSIKRVYILKVLRKIILLKGLRTSSIKYQSYIYQHDSTEISRN
jgi:hypothetical protein